MKIARCKTNPEVFVRAADYNKAVHGAVICNSCRCAVLGKAAYTRNKDEQQISVRAFYSVFPKTRHKESCKYNAQRTVDVMVARSSKVTALDENAIIMLARDSGKKKAEFRLHIMMDSVRAGSCLTLASTNLESVRDQSIGGHHIHSSRVLRSYLNTAKCLLGFIARLEGSKDISKLVTFKYKDQTIQWENFFFNYDQQQNLLERLMDMDQRGKPYHPVAFVVRTRDCRVMDKMSGDTPIKLSRHLLSCRGQSLALFTMLYVKPDFLVPKIQRTDYLLICTIPRPLKAISPVSPQKGQQGWKDTLALYLPISSPAQVCSFYPAPS